MDAPALFCWPDRTQELLLRASILEDEGAKTAWEDWTRTADFEDLDVGSVRLLPEVYTKLRSSGVDHPYFRRMKGIKRKTWLENQLLFHQATEAIGILQRIGMDTMVTKGPALVLQHYRDFGRRPMNDFDIVVRTNRAEEAIAALLENGFTPREPDDDPTDLDLTHAVPFVNDTGRQFDLHWHVVAGCTDDRTFWDHAVPVTFMGTETLAPAPSDLFFHVCVHGLRVNRVPPLRWVVDASVILETSEVDWDRLTHLAERFSFGYRLREALEYLKQFDIGVPDHVVATLPTGRGLSLQRVEFELVTGSRPKSIQTQIAYVWLGFKRFSGSKSSLLHIWLLPGYLERVWNAGSVWSLPWMAVQKGMRRLLMNPR